MLLSPGPVWVNQQAMYKKYLTNASRYGSPRKVGLGLKRTPSSLSSTALFPFPNMYLRLQRRYMFRKEKTSFPLSQGCVSASSWGLSKESLSLLHKAFLRPLFTYASPGWFLFLSVTKLERLHRAVSRAITGCLSSSPIPLLLSEASLPRLRVTLSCYALSSHERALRLPTSFPILGLPDLK